MHANNKLNIPQQSILYIRSKVGVFWNITAICPDNNFRDKKDTEKTSNHIYDKDFWERRLHPRILGLFCVGSSTIKAFHSTTFNMLNDMPDLFQQWTWHDTLFNICWTAFATYVGQLTLNRMLGLRLITPYCNFASNAYISRARSISIIALRTPALVYT